MTITEESVAFYKRGSLRRLPEVQAVSFEELYKVQLIPPRGGKVGILTVRGAQNKYVPLPENLKGAMDDKTSVYFTAPHYERFLAIYVVLKQCADIANGDDN